MLKSELAASDKIKLIQDFDKFLGLNLYQQSTLPQWVETLVEEREIARKKELGKKQITFGNIWKKKEFFEKILRMEQDGKSYRIIELTQVRFAFRFL